MSLFAFRLSISAWVRSLQAVFGRRGAVCAVLALGVGAGQAANAQTAWTVTTFTDTNFATLETGGGFGPGVGSGSSGELRYVLFKAMANGGVNTITFPGCTTASPCTIVLGAPLPPIFETSNISSFSLTIDGGTQGAVIIDGNSGGANTTSGALTTNRVFFVDNVAVTLKNLVIQNAKAQGGAGGGGGYGDGGGGGAGFGAGLFVNQSTAAVVVQNTTFTNCSVVGGAGGNPNYGGGGGGGGLTFAGGNGFGGSQGSYGGGGGGVSGAGASASLGAYGGSGGSGGNGGGGGGASTNINVGNGGSAYADNASGVGGGSVGNESKGGFGGGGGGGAYTINGGNGGFGGGGGGAYSSFGGNGGFGGGGGGSTTSYPGSSAAAVGGVQGGAAGGGGAAAGPAIFVVNGSVTLYTTTGSGFTATAGAAGGSGATAGTASAVPVFNYGGTVNGSKSVGPIANAFTVTEPVGQTSATQTATLTFTTAVTASNSFTINVLTQGAANQDFNLVSGGTCASGTAYAVGGTCTVEYSFTPTHPGQRLGGITLTSTSAITSANPNGTVASTLITGTGTGPQVVFNAPLTPSKLGGGFSDPDGVAVDGSGNVYVANTGNSAVEVMANTCTSSSCVRNLGGGFNYPGGVAVDGIGNVYVADSDNNVVKVMSNTCTSSSCVSTLGGGFYGPEGVGVDGSGNVYVADYGNSAVKVMSNTCASSSCVSTLGGGFNFLSGVAVDGSGNVYVADYGNSAVKVMSNTCTSSSCVTTLGGGFYLPVGVTVDGSGNVYVADTNHSAVKVMSNTCTSSSCVTTLGGGFRGPYGVAVDGSGNIYVADTFNSAVKEMARATPPTVAFATTTDGSTDTTGGSTDTTDGTHTVTVQNNGNQPLVFAIPTAAGTTNPTTAPDFTFTTTSSSACPSLTTSATNTATLAPGATCNLPLTFTPVAPASGPLSESLTFTDNNLNASAATQTITLSGTAVLPTPASTLNSSVAVSPSPAVAGSSVTVTVTVTDSGGNAITGATAAFSSTSSTASFGTPSTNGNVITATLTDTMAETAPISVNLGGNASGTLTGSAQFVAPAYTVVSTSDPATGNGTASNCVDINLPSYSAAANQSCELRDAVAAANALIGVTTNISFSSLFATAQTILIAQSTPITITASMNITGPGANLLTIEGGTMPLSSSNKQVFQQTGGTVTLSGLTVANGYTTVKGGGLYQTGGSLTVSNSTFSGNQASGNGPVGNGGAIYATSTLTVTNSTFSGNQASGSGLGAGVGGAIYAISTLTVSNTTFSGNQASGSGLGFGEGGAILATSTLTVSNSTFSGNQATSSRGIGYGGAIFASSTLTVSNSIFSNDTSSSGSGIYAYQPGGTFGNLLNDSAHSDSFFNVPSTALISGAANLSALGNYGGPTQTLLPLPGSATICAGTVPTLNGTPLTTDQRGVAISGMRYGQTNCYDIGAVQTSYALAGPLTVPSLVTPGSAVTPAPTVSLTENGAAFTGGTATVTLTDVQSDLSSGASATNSLTTGVVTFGSVQFTTAETTDQLTATLTLNPRVPVSLQVASNSFQVGQLPQAITNFNPPATAIYGQGSITLSATGGASGNPVTFKVTNGGPGLISGNQLTITGAGTIKLEADQAGNTVYSAANPVTAYIVVSPAVLTVTIVGNPTKVYDGTTTATLTSSNYQVNGVVSPDVITVTQPTGTYAAATAGPETVTAALTASSFSAASGSLNNYTLPISATGNGIITQASSTTVVTCTPSTVIYNGLAQTPCTASVSGAGGLSQSVTPVNYSSNNNAGVNTASASATFAGDLDHSPSSGSATFTITQATPVVTWANPPSIVYGTGTGPAQKTATATGVGGVSLQGSYFYTTPDGTIFTVGTHPLGVAFTPNDTTDYVPVSAYAYLTVTKATPTVNWSAPAAITYGTALSATQLNATSSVPGSFSYSPAAGAVLHAGSQTLSVTFTPSDTTDYNPVTTTVLLTVNKATPVITWPTPASFTYGTPISATQLNATASYLGSPVAGTFVYTAETGPNPLGVLLPPGTTALSATINPTDSTDFNSATAYVVFTVSKAQTTTTLAVTTTQTVTGTTATITPTVKPQIGGTPTGTITYYSGSTVLGSAAVGTPFTTGVLPVGTDQITAVYSGDSNFVGSSSAATAVVSIAPTTITLIPALTHVFYPGSAVSFTVIVPLKNLQLISGTITLYDGSTVIGTYSLPAGGVLAGITPQLSVGTHNLRAVYSGNTQYPPGESPIGTVTVTQ